jgi:hypothetical protein
MVVAVKVELETLTIKLYRLTFISAQITAFQTIISGKQNFF